MAKKFVPRQRKHKVLAREALEARRAAVEDGAIMDPQADSNAVEILPDAKKAADEAKRAQMRTDLKGEAKMSSKKAKRLEKYIDKKLAKDENRALLAQLAANKIDTSLFASVRHLGTVKETKREIMSRALRERAAGIAQTDESILFERRREPAMEDSADDDSERESFLGRGRELSQQSEDLSKPKKPDVPEPPAPSAATGSGLKRPLELDDEGRPVLRKRQKRGGVKSKISGKPHFALGVPSDPSGDHPEGGDEMQQEDTEDEWNGLSSDEAEHGNHEEDSENEAASAADEGTSDEDVTSSQSEDDDDDDSDDEDNDGDTAKRRSSAFKAWAHEQRNSALGYEPSSNGNAILDIPVPGDFKPRPIEQDPLPLELQPTKDTGRKAFSVIVERDSSIQEARLKLPVVAEEQRIMEAIHNNNVVIICGATGSGKSTQVPQMLFEAGYGSPNSPTSGQIVVTQPRKVAAVSVSQRVSTELGNRSDTVAYQIRFEGTASEKTSLKFVTDGVLLREIGNDISLRNYSAVVIDEAHERSLNTDILIGMLSRTVKLREEMANENPAISPLKLIIMSATLRISDVTNATLFPSPPPVLDIEGRQYPVTIHFSRRTESDFVDEAFKKIIRGHRKLPPGSMLVFLTSHSDISRLSQKLKLHSTGLKAAHYPKVRFSANDGPLEVEDIEFGQTDDVMGTELDELPFIGDEQDIDEEEENEFDVPNETGQVTPLNMHILPLYSLLPTREQMRVFEEPPEGTRSIILATNVAETSLTIPGVKYVIDCGRSKERVFDPNTGVQRYEIGFISKASANQRSGRAGRTGPGHTWRLYSSAVYERDFQEFADPEILKMPIEGVVLQLKAMNLKHVVNFPFPTSPDRHNLAKAEKLLQYLSAITPEGHATQIGKTMSKLPLPPRFARILLVGHLHDCLPYTIALVAGLSVAEIFLPESQVIPASTEGTDQKFRTNEDLAAENARAQARRKYNQVHRNFRSLDDASDAIKLLQVVGEFAHSPSEHWCTSRFVRFKALQETQKLRKQITMLLQKDIPAFANLTFQERLDRPSAKQITALKQMIAAGFIDQVAIRGDLAPVPPEMQRKPRRAIDVPYLPLQPLQTSSRPAASNNSDDPLVDRAVYIHPSSNLAHYSLQELPDYIVYSGLQRSSASGPIEGAGAKRPKTRMLALTDVTGAQLSALAKGTPLVTYGKPIKEVQVVAAAAGAAAAASTRECWVVPYLRAEATGGQGWPLPVKKVTQKKVPSRGWVTE
ncbi:putative DEAH-box RNA helicase [Rosellinia necatrix]|uniref:RNA helicase n=1 Tax=Rosellinia necatrix TaxID=77044 RepID=A0A1W2TT37_ROSNE|nr:putative DEAH-box RNA helicase [Rosellinia necatrix]